MPRPARSITSIASSGAPLSAMEKDAPATLSSDQPRIETENAGAVGEASDQPCDKAVEVMPAVSTEELSTERTNDTNPPLVSAPPAEPVRAVRRPEALPDTGAGSAAPAFEPEILQLVVRAETTPADVSTAKTATVIADHAAVETTVPVPNDGTAAKSDNSASPSSLKEMEDGHLPMPQIVPGVAEGSAQEPRVPETRPVRCFSEPEPSIGRSCCSRYRCISDCDARARSDTAPCSRAQRRLARRSESETHDSGH